MPLPPLPLRKPKPPTNNSTPTPPLPSKTTSFFTLPIGLPTRGPSGPLSFTTSPPHWLLQ
ncbi:hypothetical protein FH972_020582 [Carpinus fangiana]|uniref:Uncharacterized protein n=1 Tax=Carpinus fangiana TaxID=176857 RepID=A0A5N6RVU4_9ROSI|nr:hypothetical protein FH972_020582 [Carpinus fangiana]